MRILFICHGNICRSPMAEFVCRAMLRARGLTGIIVDSAATSTEELGNPPHHGTRRVLRDHGVPTIPHTARQITTADYAAYDLLIGMDSANIRNILRIVGNDPEQKVSRLLDFSDHPRDIADPWYTGDFEQTYVDVCEGCEALIRAVESASCKSE